MKRSIYLKSTDIEDAKRIFHDALNSVYQKKHTETVQTEYAYGRVIAQPIYARRSVPFYPSSAMDGIAIDSAKTKNANEHKPLLLDPSDYIEVDTGDPILDPYDCVIMAEDCIHSDSGVSIIKPHVPWENVRPIGEDVTEGELLFSMEHVLRPMDISVLIAANQLSIEVYKKVSIAIIPTGTEIRSAYEPISVGDIVESNSYLFTGLALLAQALPTTYPIVKDDFSEIKHTVEDAVSKHDVVIINAGSSAGRDDYTVHVISELGKVLVHGLSIKPGKPAILGLVGDVPVIGIPGFPVSAHIVFEEFVTPLLLKLNHYPIPHVDRIEAYSTRRIVSSLKSKEYIRVKIGYIHDRYVATPLARGAGMMMSVVKSDGYALIEKNREGVDFNEMMDVQLNKPIQQIKHTLLAIGSHDLIMDVISNLFEQSTFPYHCSSVHIGSYAGLLALSRKESALAMTHLLESDGSYNTHTVKKLFPSEKVVMIKGVKRIQGLIVEKGNPKNIHTIEDLLRIRFINRQRGAGTRVLLDHWLNQKNINPESIVGYNKELTTHLAVAAAVANNVADCGLGIQSAATIMGCDFIPLGLEDYDFVCYADFLNDPLMMLFLTIIRSDEFKNICKSLGGYDTSESGEVRIYD
ncbi:MAG: molybdopterin biosynthesis protein [Firmicutes bacterium HGW-Firmicutes-20]|nr:MAG: molybdopterin biosynthesis protein [Firmicutes bacterium HGW-Firmicutes-20]PKM69727.1 MAG: molybdopterin biosynthesis protein [Firmicutes bacterium HGW-Firmicutes-19]